MAYRKTTVKNTKDQRPQALQDGKLNQVVGNNLRKLQDECDWTNAQMAELLGMTVTNYDRIKKGEHGLNAEKLSILYYSLGVNLNRLVCNDNSYGLIRKPDDADVTEFDFSNGLGNLIIDIQSTENYEERVSKILHVYDEFGKMLFGLMKPENRPSEYK
ncbi:helix-turn-helix domain-containing protein [Butyrivibrio sp.]|uniref:helix-turn-helix domain-containing protein n=1 Tax=Butyrivibrio sp. TaxID=28121 RepID=UPI0025B7FA85|nr:helix-turn-helix transcriptional regulator [Butyrivibrio sp.]MBQ9306066.1 helix-turn-helix transcriptional regulator [Butyrivibrio sp.]